ncbi:peptide-methionine (S)-S-oxide reductase MsrA [Limnohabitans sp. 2KL-3]|uniref:peptide-methionine (S)-S-oxide reductase MsrA n=1 Tax=Limnohabitans sp. 2KL-3 TaxID=1100700 RepID=UPI000A51839D|nr:peptide-methionine (S)-S-oxide reductase MsrA [Limnohabitans sp. 2KL-3]
MNRMTVSRPLRCLAMACAAAAFLLTACTPSQSSSAGQAPVAQTTPTEVVAAPVVNGKPMAYALFAGGCFWCIEADFEKLAGVVAVESGYTAGQTPQPTYEQVSAGHTGHTEAVRVLYDPSQVGYAQLVDYFWRHIDPTVKDQQFCDVGPQYRSGIYWQNEAERAIAEASRDDLIRSGRFSIIHTELAPSSVFYLAEEYHQDYYKKNELRYSYYRLSCGRDARVKKLWG